MLFVLSVYVLGKSLQAEGLRAVGGIILSGFLLLICAFGAYCFIDEAIRNYFRKKRECREESDRIHDGDW